MAEEIKKTSVSPQKKNTSGKVEEGNTIKVHYKGTLEDGSVFDSSEGKDPIEFTVGSHGVIPGFEQAVVGMAVGEKKNITLQPEALYVSSVLFEKDFDL